MFSYYIPSLMFVFFLQDFMNQLDPDIIIGYNICKFDLPYLIEVISSFAVFMQMITVDTHSIFHSILCSATIRRSRNSEYSLKPFD